MLAETFDGIHITDYMSAIAATSRWPSELGAVLSLDNNINTWPDNIAFQQLSAGNILKAHTLIAATQFIHTYRKQGKHVLLQSAQHPSRLIVIALAYYLEYKKIPVPLAFYAMTNDLLHCPINPGDFYTLSQHYHLKYTRKEMDDSLFFSTMLLHVREVINNVRSGLFISGMYIHQKLPLVHDAGIKAVLRLNRDPEHIWPEEEFTVLHLPIPDGQPLAKETLLQGTAFIHEQRQKYRKVLVHCYHGISRSATFVLAYLIEYKKMSLAEAYYVTQSARPIIFPHPYLLLSLVEHYNLPYTEIDIMAVRFRQHLYDEGHKIYQSHSLLQPLISIRQSPDSRH